MRDLRRASWPLALTALALVIHGPPALAASRVVLISIDGLRPDVINTTDTPNIAALRDSGAVATNALNDLPSATLPNHATMLTGLVSDVHGININWDTPGIIGVPTVFDFAHNAGLRCALLASKTKMDGLAPPESVETIVIDGNTAALTEQCVALLHADGPDLIFLHLRDPDSVGHAAGWLSEPYFQAVRGVDAQIGQVVAAIKADASRQTYILLTSDHGGDGTNHFLNIPENRQIPWCVCGPDIPAGLALSEEVTTADTTPTILWLLGVDVPAGLSGRARTSIRGGGTVDSAGVPVAPIGMPCVLLAAPAGLAAFWLARQRSWRAGPRDGNG